MLPMLNRWNHWGSAKLEPGYRREVLDKILPFLNTPEVVALTGLRRSGKTTILYQLMDYLLSEGVEQKAILHVNFEEPSIAPGLKLSVLDEIYQCYRERIYPTGKAYLFFDEIQNVPEWERWVRARNENEEVKIFITGSSASLMSRELGTLLTGRHVNFYVSPLSFLEYLTFKTIEIPPYEGKIDPPPIIANALNQYITWGGLPEVVLSQDQNRSEMLLKQYFEDLLFRDVAMRHQIRDVTTLRNIAIHLLTQTASLISFTRIANLFNISKEMTKSYCEYLEEAFLLDFLPYYSIKVGERQRNPRKLHVYDLGIRQVVSYAHLPDEDRMIETLVYQHLQRKYRGDVFYWKGDQEIDLVIRRGNTIKTVYQVVCDQLDDSTVKARELNSLQEAAEVYPFATQYLITAKLPKWSDQRLMPLWIFLLS